MRELGAAEQRGSEGADETAPVPELTKAAGNYVDLHRHTAVKAVLLTEPGSLCA